MRQAGRKGRALCGLASAAALQRMCARPLLTPCWLSCVAPCRALPANPSKALKKLRKQRLAATKGIVKGQKKRAAPL